MDPIILILYILVSVVCICGILSEAYTNKRLKDLTADLEETDIRVEHINGRVSKIVRYLDRRKDGK